jgi:hypothetical protein
MSLPLRGCALQVQYTSSEYLSVYFDFWCPEWPCFSGTAAPVARCSVSLFSRKGIHSRVSAALHSCIPNLNIVTETRYLCMLHSSRTMQLQMTAPPPTSSLLVQLFSKRKQQIVNFHHSARHSQSSSCGTCPRMELFLFLYELINEVVHWDIR